MDIIPASISSIDVNYIAHKNGINPKNIYRIVKQIPEIKINGTKHQYICKDGFVTTQKPIKKPPKPSPYKAQIEEVLNHIQQVTGIIHDANKTNSSLITKQLKEGFTVDNLKYVIDIKQNDWKGTEYEKYVRPSTLFGDKFLQYLQQKNTVKNNSTTFQKNYDATRQAQEHINSSNDD